MKKILALCLTAVLCLCGLASCSSAHKENEWFSEEKLTKCLVGDLPTITKDYVNHNDEDIYAELTDSEFKAYVKSVYDYLCSQAYKYLGTRGEQVGTLAGTFTTYYFKPATELSEFYVDSAYRFVYSDGTLDEDGDLIFCILSIYDYEAKNLEYGTKNFAYNTLITLDYKSEAPMGGFYVLNEEEHEHTITYVSAGEAGHFENYTCGCSQDLGAVPHYDENGDYICDACGYEYDECNHQWDDGIEIEGGLGGYVMEYTCLLCGIKERETITIIPPSGVSHSISYQSDITKEFLMEGFAPTESNPGDTVVLRTHPIMDADLAFYANGIKLTQTHADSDYWEYVFTMPDEDVVITHEISDGFLS
ncbi:MAG: hypothetical protein IJW53_04685 [Clostridia bacterium]|nr:hypothetical protein [Clostridia bacterium]